jgi:hypothetical protein
MDKSFPLKNSDVHTRGEAQRTEIVARPYKKDDAGLWEGLVAESWNGTFLHQRKFLSYHGERFQDLSLVLEDGRGRIVGVFPAALDPGREGYATSHPGLTYGGIIHAGSLRGEMMIEALQAIAKEYRAAGLRFLRYKAVPHIYHRVPSADDLYALFCLGAALCRCDLSATIDLPSRPRSSKLRRRDLNRARRSGVQIVFGSCYFEAFWPVLEENLTTKHRVSPVHTIEEIKRLQSIFPEQIECVVGKLNDEVVAGAVLFRTPQVIHAQYIGSTALSREVAAMTAVLEQAIVKSEEWGARYFDFGISTEDGGRRLNSGLQQFKTSFGAGGVTYEFYDLDLENAVSFLGG